MAESTGQKGNWRGGRSRRPQPRPAQPPYQPPNLGKPSRTESGGGR